MASHGTKRKLNEPNGTSVNCTQIKMKTENTIVEQATEIMALVKKKVQAMKNADETKTELQNYIEEAISRMNKNSRTKKTIGILGESGQGKSSLLNAILEKQYLLPSGCYGACTAVITQIEANLIDTNYKAEIELISKEEWESHLEILLGALSTDSEEMNDSFIEDAKEKITALYGVNAEKKSFEELKNDDKFAEITKDFFSSNAAEFAKKLRRYTQYNQSNPGGWYWPLVKSVTVKIPNCHELLEHIVLVDLPGTGDYNKIRNDLWKSKLRDCSSVWILSDISRATTKKDTWEMLKYCTKDMMEAGECRDIHFICTKSDNIEPVEYMSDLEDEMTEDEDLKLKCILHRNKTAKETVLKTFQNSKIKKEMDLKVFTVSSKAFFDQSLRLNQDETEIPMLQGVLKNINKRINQEMARGCVTEAKAVMSLIQSKRMAKTEVHKVLERSLENALEKLGCHFDMLCSLLSQTLSNGVEQSKMSCRDSVEEQISPVLPQGNRGFHKILHALCKNDGHYRSKAWKQTFNLNECLSSHMYEDFDHGFNLIFSVNAKTGISMHELIDAFSIVTCGAVLSASSMPNYVEDFIKAQEDKLKKTLKGIIVDRKKNIYTSIQKTIKSAMASSYNEAAQYRGEGSLIRKQQKLLNDIEALKLSMFEDAKNEVLRQSKELMGEIKQSLKQDLNKSIQHSFATQQITLFDVSSEIKELERLSVRLSD
ncbi:nuclear GTPase SLIP-GC-like [Danio aesculapii]|uniref:nuclear GTPase SLIP-GC-like n=1 Tax=Danio aesculapii TaxID=1142201 RepID=UPI0024C07D97|nr:nuclear GTPase SLIP-GC-like [Danio aesculapii]